MKRLRPLLLLLPLLLFGSCLQIERIPPQTDATIPATKSEQPTAEHTLPPWSEALPTWSDSEALLAAEAILRTPSGGIVDVSQAAYSHTDLQTDLQSLAAIYGKHFSYRTIGTSLDGRSLYLGILGNSQAKHKLLVSAGIHGREYMTSQLVMKQLEFYLQHYNSGSYCGVPYSVLFEEVCVYIVPMVNPDGIALSQEGLSGIRSPALRQKLHDIFEAGGHSYKNEALYFSHWKASANGVDLNRNFDALWESYGGASAPAASQYKGDFPISEPESRALADLVDSTDGLIASLCIHSQGEVLYWNCGQPNPARSQRLAEVISARNGYEVILEQNNDASFSDWCELEQDIPAITVEIGKSPGSLVLPIDQFAPIWRANYDLWPLTVLHFVTN